MRWCFMKIMDWSRRLISGNCAITIFLITGSHTHGRTPGQDRLLPAVAASRTTAQDMKVLMMVSCCAHLPLTMLDIAAAGANTDHYHRHFVTAEIVPRVRSSLLTAACPAHVSRVPRVRITCPQCVSPLRAGVRVVAVLAGAGY